MPKTKHIHKYTKVSGRNTQMFKCAFPDCTFFVSQGQFELLIDRMSYCHKCNEKFIMTERSLDEDKPICDECKLKQSLKAIGINEIVTDEVTIEDLDGYLSIKGIE